MLAARPMARKPAHPALDPPTVTQPSTEEVGVEVTGKLLRAPGAPAPGTTSADPAIGMTVDGFALDGVTWAWAG